MPGAAAGASARYRILRRLRLWDQRARGVDGKGPNAASDLPAWQMALTVLRAVDIVIRMIKEPRKTNYSINVTPETHADISIMAGTLGVSRSSVVTALVQAAHVAQAKQAARKSRKLPCMPSSDTPCC